MKQRAQIHKCARLLWLVSCSDDCGVPESKSTMSVIPETYITETLDPTVSSQGDQCYWRSRWG